MALPGIFQDTIFSRRLDVQPSPYIRAMHPKSEIRPDRAAIKRVLDAGWVGQLKVHGHRVQLHVPADPDVAILAYTRTAKLHTKALPAAAVSELRRLFQPGEGWTCLDGEWLKATDELFIFDVLRHRGRLLGDLSYQERWEMLPRVFASDVVRTLPLLRTVDACMEALAAPESWVEGLVFKALTTPGFADTSIIRCRRR